MPNQDLTLKNESENPIEQQDNKEDNSDGSDQNQYQDDDYEELLLKNPNRLDEKHLKTITLVSFGFANGEPKISGNDTIISVRNMFNVEKRLRDNHNGTSTELQRALMDMEINKQRYDEILRKLIVDLTDMINTDEDEEITVFVGCETGKHQSVAVICMLFNDLPEVMANLLIKNQKNKEISINIEHYDLEQKI